MSGSTAFRAAIIAMSMIGLIRTANAVPDYKEGQV
jgi:hypothetical protein